MTDDEYLTSLAEQISALLRHFQNSSHDGLYLPVEQQARFKRLVAEAKSTLDTALGIGNHYSIALIGSSATGGFFGGPSYAGTLEVAELLQGAVNQIKRKSSRISVQPQITPAYVDASTINKLRSIQSTKWDFKRLIRLCEELNLANEKQSSFTVAMLVRAIVDHVPPIFSQKNFAGVANNYACSRSLKASLLHLENSLRNIADAHLHEQIRDREAVPSMAQVNFRNDLEVLLSEIIRIS